MTTSRVHRGWVPIDGRQRWRSTLPIHAIALIRGWARVPGAGGAKLDTTPLQRGVT